MGICAAQYGKALPQVVKTIQYLTSTHLLLHDLIHMKFQTSRLCLFKLKNIFQSNLVGFKCDSCTFPFEYLYSWTLVCDSCKATVVSGDLRSSFAL